MSIAICTGCSRCVEGDDLEVDSETKEEICPHCGDDVGHYNEDADWR